MKRFLKFTCAAVLIIGICTATTAVSAASEPNALQISAISVFQDFDDIVVQITVSNVGSAPIDEYGIAIAFYDENDNRVFGNDASLTGYMEEICNWYYTPEDGIPAGGDYITEDVFTGYSQATEVAIAIRYYHDQDGDYIVIPESDWLWIQPGNESENQDTDRGYYTQPPETLYDAISDYGFGYSYYLLDDYNAPYYDKSQGGEWITGITDGSDAALAGLEVGDLVITADDVKPTQNLYAVEYAMAAIVNGEETEWVYERNGVIYAVTIGPQ